MDPESRSRALDVATRVFAVIGFVAIIGAGLWGTASVARGIPNAFSAIASAIVSLTSIFVPANEQITISVPSLTVLSGEEFSISWEHVNKSVEGSYTFRYDCADGVSFTSPTASGSLVTVFCNTPFNFLNERDSITLTPASTVNRFIDVTLHVDFTPNGQNTPTVTGSTLLTIANEAITGSPSTITPPTGGTTTQPPRGSVSAGTETTSIHVLPTNGSGVSSPTGAIDLSARVIAVGVVEKATGTFTASSTPNRALTTHRVAVKFAVENNGTRTSPQWTFNAVLPTFPSHVFSSPVQPSLAPGDRIEFTLGFDSFVDKDEGTLVINVDPTSSVNEPNKTNNILTYVVNTKKY